jgi:hypothetical protein
MDESEEKGSEYRDYEKNDIQPDSSFGKKGERFFQLTRSLSLLFFHILHKKIGVT